MRIVKSSVPLVHCRIKVIIVGRTHFKEIIIISSRATRRAGEAAVSRGKILAAVDRAINANCVNGNINRIIVIVAVLIAADC
ncbi:MAG: hypothetical protein UV20_C0035G0008 [Candidatus Magasanikbacteria bacterium GW2011_GWA2_42_32]|uniref:Uncharacterized protein n=1 Tax=Candidatus Magasanikbacteria bacterium GW2011_GWA2_42_32 TaxID=1619039 RepID=A0A0G0ZZY8_9BACT|nr:MAG: hypothetical protein UV20_C0035G0008 [Candidatus Magasanikbacteria bacterium GW2011_GWA2_42_32]